MEVIRRPDSSNIAKVEYDAKREEMFVTFKSGGYYRYTTVPEHVFRSFGNVSSAGKYFAANVKGKYPYSRIHK